MKAFFTVAFLALGAVIFVANRPKAAAELRPAHWINEPPATSLEELRGQPVLLEFWATWCPPCRQTMPHLNKVHRELGGKGLVILSVSDEPRDKVRSFVRSMKLRFPIAAECRSNYDYGVKSIPRAFLIDPNGKIVWEGHPMDPEWEDKARAMLGA